MGNQFGSVFRISTFGESHSGGVGVVIDGCPSGYKIDLSRVQYFLSRRRPGQSAFTTPRQEWDEVECLSGLEDTITLGTPIALLVRNKDTKQKDYEDIQNVYRPSHADYTTQIKFGIRAHSGGGRSSARETIGRVAAAAVAEQILEILVPGYRVVAFVQSIYNLAFQPEDLSKIDHQIVEMNPLRCPHQKTYESMAQLLEKTRKAGDSLGGVVQAVVHHPPIGLGEPVFDKLEADLAKGMLSLPASKGFEIGEGFAAAKMKGSEHNDAFMIDQGEVYTKTNHAGGIQGGISNGQLINFRVAFKPVSTIFLPQQTLDIYGQPVIFKPKAGRHDPCVAPRAVPIVEAMTHLVIMDHYLQQSIRQQLRLKKPAYPENANNA